MKVPFGVLLAGLVFTCRAPLMGNQAGVCTAPALVPITGPCVVHVRLQGPLAREDSVSTTAGSVVSLVFPNLPGGAYTVRGWSSNAAGAGCDTTFVAVVATVPWKPLFK